MGRRVGAVLAGIVVVGVSVSALQWLSGRLYPLPADVELGTAAFDSFVAGLPPTAWLLVFGSEVVGAFLGGLTAGWIARDHARVYSSFIVGLAVLGSVFNWTSFSHPLWFVLGQLIAYPFVLRIVWVLLERPAPRVAEAT